jgi:hypothetical protein
MAKTRSKQRPYKMKGCFKRSRKRKYLGGALNNPFLSYSGQGGAALSQALSQAYPSSGPNPNGFGFLNSQNGGSCGCGSPLMSGGSKMCEMKGGTNALVGKPWGGAIQQWPGVNGGRNHLGYNTYSPNDVSRQMKYSGGRRRKFRTRKQRGGFIANDLINLSKFGAGSFYNAIKGYPQPVSPLPWKDQLTKYE